MIVIGADGNWAVTEAELKAENGYILRCFECFIVCSRLFRSDVLNYILNLIPKLNFSNRNIDFATGCFQAWKESAGSRIFSFQNRMMNVCHTYGRPRRGTVLGVAWPTQSSR